LSDAEEVRAHLPEVLRSLKGLRYQLLGLLASLPPAPSEEEELRSALECAAHDHFKPLLEALASVLGGGLGEPG
jgi:hypothetical protein